MFWLTIRQHRMQLVVTTAALAVIGVVLLVNAISTRGAMAGVSGDALDALLSERVELVRDLVTWLPAAPVLIGLFWGAPLLAREIENGTHILAWTQSVTRRRWLGVKLAWLAAAVTACGLALGAMTNAWLSTFAGTDYAMRFRDIGMFAVTGVAAAGWWLFAFTLGVAAGALLRKLLPAIAVTIGVFFLVLFGMFTLRDSYAVPERIVTGVEIPMQEPVGDAMVVDTRLVAPDGTEHPMGPVPGCFRDSLSGLLDCLQSSGFGMATYVQPADRYWRFQWSEAGILAGAAVLLAGVTYQRVTRRAI